jgi:hypothetical protein
VVECLLQHPKLHLQLLSNGVPALHRDVLPTIK